MGTIIIGLLVLAVALLLYVIAQGKKDKNNVRQNEDPLAGLPDIIGRPKSTPSYSSTTTNIQGKRESGISATDNFDKINEGTSKISEMLQEGPDAVNTKPDLKEEEQEMQEYAAFEKNEDFATGITFDELAIAQEMLARQSLHPTEEKTAITLVSKIDGTELLGLLESKIGDASKRIALLLDRGIAKQPDDGTSTLRDGGQENFEIRDYV
ncbi:hypothetical protein [Flavobacterium psychrotrophum]|uniref:hypothetical protein n=1 Tax=Flavobacterium psychrotrophum TaxID=2294119 RepID=UPI000E3166A2|nr:hypothetical protein [Flavobacterium psychrotrophum]